MTSAFYLHWISPDQVIHEGEEAYIGCEAVGLEDLTYEWRVSKDGGDPAYDGKSGGKGIPQLGDEDMASLAAIAGAGIFASLALMLALMRPKKREEEEAAE